MAYQKIYGIPTRTMWITPSDYALIPCPSDLIYQGRTTDDSGDPEVIYDSAVDFEALGVTAGCVILIKKPTTGQGWGVARTIKNANKGATGSLELNEKVLYTDYVTGLVVNTDYAIYRPPTKPCIVSPSNLKTLLFGTYADKPFTFLDCLGNSTDTISNTGINAMWLSGAGNSINEFQGASNIWPLQFTKWMSTSPYKGSVTKWEDLINPGGGALPDSTGCQLLMGSW